MKAKLAVIIVFLFASTAFGQTGLEIETKFGQALRVYSVSEHIWMTPEYAPDGQVCQMRLFAKRVGPDTNYLTSPLPFQELKLVLNQLVPPSIRGMKDESFGLTDTGGGVAWTTYHYEKVVFVFIFPLRVTADALKQGESVSLDAEEMSSYEKPAKTPPSGNDFDNSQNNKLEIVTINWTGRKCAAQ